ncbi:delta-sarcoglycan-like isoform X2 [Varroa jacobsoni]|uniref:delta-sarcoglycan-like isoform X2 n=1 Tax=Varroa jacobsoni TaxID=62625 RepID=UPI000BF3DEFE|nr:delta-sarcoglycan-like isoform X2 [Varroa jacobsoni]
MSKVPFGSTVQTKIGAVYMDEKAEAHHDVNIQITVAIAETARRERNAICSTMSVVMRSSSFRERSPPAISLDQWDFGKRPSQAILAIELNHHRASSRSCSSMFETSSSEYQLGIYGWRKKLLYLIVFVLSWLLVANLLLTLWIIRVLHFSMDGVAHLKIDESSVKFTADAHFLRGIYTNYIRHSAKWEEAYTDPFQKTNSLVLNAAGEVRLRSLSRDGIVNEVVVGESKFFVKSDDFSVFSSGEELLLRVTNDTLYVKQATVHVENGVRLEKSLQTPQITSGEELLIESPMARLGVQAPGPVLVESRAGDIYLAAYDTLTLDSRDQIYFDSSDIRLSGLSAAATSIEKTSLYSNNASENSAEVLAFPLCICAPSGKLFLGSLSGNCTPTNHIC